MKFLKLFSIILTAAVAQQCSSPTEPNPFKPTLITETPTITGFYVTTLEYPDGTGEVIGNPAYRINKINVVPNPCRTTAPPNPWYGDPLIIFTHLSDSSVILIIRGTNGLENAASESSVLGAPKVRSWPVIVRRIEKNGIDYFSAWDLKDNKGDYVTSGYYRAYFYGPKVPAGYFLDFALELKDRYLEQY